MEDKVRSTLDKVIQLAKLNAEFASELRKALGIVNVSNTTSIDNNRLKHIEKYLGLDYYVDTQASITDYSFVSFADIRAQLISDNREMMRFRYGTRYHEINFSEFCRYAQLQVEMLLNYYYDQKNNSNLSDIKNHIKTYNEDAKGIDTAKTLAAISYNVKLWAFTKEYNISGAFDLWNNVREARNELSHRSPEYDKTNIDEYQKKLISLEIPLYKNGYVNWSKINSDNRIKNLYETQIKKSYEYKRYKYLLWLKSKPFDSIIYGLRQIAKLISENL